MMSIVGYLGSTNQAVHVGIGRWVEETFHTGDLRAVAKEGIGQVSLRIGADGRNSRFPRRQGGGVCTENHCVIGRLVSPPTPPRKATPAAGHEIGRRGSSRSTPAGHRSAWRLARGRPSHRLRRRAQPGYGALPRKPLASTLYLASGRRGRQDSAFPGGAWERGNTGAMSDHGVFGATGVAGPLPAGWTEAIRFRSSWYWATISGPESLADQPRHVDEDLVASSRCGMRGR